MVVVGAVVTAVTAVAVLGLVPPHDVVVVGVLVVGVVVATVTAAVVVVGVAEVTVT